MNKLKTNCQLSIVNCQLKKVFFLTLCLFLSIFVRAQEACYTSADEAVFNRYMEYITPYKTKPFNEVIIASGKFFLDRPYVAHTLEMEPEQLVINLRELDCTTFIENVLALSRTVKGEAASFNSYLRNLRQIRYRNGEIEDYTSRLHYMTDWIASNEAAGIVKDITKEIGGVPLNTALFFMSQHPDSYKQLKDPAQIRKMKEIESRLNKEAVSYYIPKQAAPDHLHQLQNGDIVLFTTSIEGLDVTHVGFIYKVGEETTFIHASTSGKKVVINEQPLVEYMNRIKSNTGMIILRPLL